ncbi:MAG: DUF4360 domain-containing protein [Deltaproteobacteria bacterium]|nr:DUF4360 domain-containing protein [Deltaproteobacteria bacterium]
MKKRLGWPAAGMIVGLMCVSNPAQANGIATIAYEGTGCPQGTIGKSISNDRQSMTLIFDSFVASTGPTVPESEEEKSCRIALTMQTNESVGITMDTRGYVQLAAGMTGDQHQNVPRAKRSNLDIPFVGPVAKDYLVRSTATVLAQGKPSSTTVTILLQVGVDKGTNASGQGQLTTDSFDLKLN